MTKISKERIERARKVITAANRLYSDGHQNEINGALLDAANTLLSQADDSAAWALVEELKKELIAIAGVGVDKAMAYPDSDCSDSGVLYRVRNRAKQALSRLDGEG